MRHGHATHGVGIRPIPIQYWSWCATNSHSPTAWWQSLTFIEESVAGFLPYAEAWKYMGTCGVVISALCTLDPHCHTILLENSLYQNLKILVCFFFLLYNQSTAVSTRQHEPSPFRFTKRRRLFPVHTAASFWTRSSTVWTRSATFFYVYVCDFPSEHRALIIQWGSR